MRTSLILTVYNESETIALLLESILKQTKFPVEVVITDAYSKDGTVQIISSFKKKFAKKGINLKILRRKGNRSIGRNAAIKEAKENLILCTDAGCILEKNWVENISKPFLDNKVDVVSGHYRGLATSVFQKCLIPYVLVMEDKIDPLSFLPASRSMAFRKKIWEKVGGFPELYSHNEDFVFATLLKAVDAKIYVNMRAVAYWIPRETLIQSFIMFMRFSFGDAEAGIFRTKVLLIIFRYFVGAVVLIIMLEYKSLIIFYFFLFCIAYYMLWSVYKNYHYVKSWKAFFMLPILQLTSDIAVIFGTSLGFIRMLLKDR